MSSLTSSDDTLSGASSATIRLQPRSTTILQKSTTVFFSGIWVTRNSPLCAKNCKQTLSQWKAAFNMCVHLKVNCQRKRIISVDYLRKHIPLDIKGETMLDIIWINHWESRTMTNRCPNESQGDKSWNPDDSVNIEVKTLWNCYIRRCNYVVPVLGIKDTPLVSNYW